MVGTEKKWLITVTFPAISAATGREAKKEILDMIVAADTNLGTNWLTKVQIKGEEEKPQE